MIKVLIVEDSLTALTVLKNIVSSAPDMEVVGMAKNGKEAVDMAAELSPDVITMDIFMPVMDGCKATKEIMRTNPRPIVVVTAHDVKELGPTFDVLAEGALDIIQKPRLMTMDGSNDLATPLLTKIRHASKIQVVKRKTPGQHPERSTSSITGELKKKQVLCIGGSAGAPGVLAAILKSFDTDFSGVIAVVQHISSPFLEGFVNWLNSQTSLEVSIASDGQDPQPGHVYLPPADHHLSFYTNGTFKISSENPVKGHKPAIDVLFHSAANVFKEGVIAVLLSGMGDDGVDGAKNIRNRGGTVFIQDPENALVSGIPQAAIKAGHYDAIISPAKIISSLKNIFMLKEEQS